MIRAQLPFALLALMLCDQIMVAQGKTDNPKDPPRRPVSSSCIEKDEAGREIIHVFDAKAFSNNAGNANVKLLISHGVPGKNDRFEKTMVMVEFWPIFVSDSNRATNVSQKNLKDILSGKIVDWKDLDTDAGKIILYLHGGKLQRQAFDALLKKLQVNPSAVRELNPVYLSSYEDLAGKAAGDRNCLVIGLKATEAKYLHPLRIDGAKIDDKKYPLTTNIYLFTESSSGGKEMKQQFLDNFDKKPRQ